MREKKGYIDYDKKRKFTYAAQKKKRDAKKQIESDVRGMRVSRVIEIKNIYIKIKST